METLLEDRRASWRDTKKRRKEMKAKLFAWGLVLILSASILSGRGQTTTQPAGDRETYRNETHGYSFTYPADCFYGPMPASCKAKPPEERPAECLCFLDAENPDQVHLEAFTGDDFTLATFSVSTYDNPPHNPPPGTDLVEWVEQNYGIHKEIPGEPNMDLGGTPALRVYDAPSRQAGSFETIFYIKNGKLFEIGLLNVDNENNRELYDQLLSGFEFSD